MPALAPTRQPDSRLAWFGTRAGQGLLAVESAAMSRVLAGIPALPWCWLGVPGAVPPETGDRRGLRLRSEGHRNGQVCFAGAVRCSVPLPLANETFGAVLVQHALDEGAPLDPLLGECERILAPGGVLWIAALNAWSPYRARWLRTGLRSRVTGRWQSALRRAGFALDSVNLQWLGPRWRMDQGDVGVGMNDWLRAGIALSARKRVHALVPPTPVRAFRWQGAAHSRVASGLERAPPE